MFGEVARKYRDPVGPDWRVDETYARIRGRWHYIYRAIDELGQIVDAYVSPTRDMSLQDAPLFNLIIALAQILGYFSAAYLVDRLGRKLTLVTCSVRRSVPTSLAASRRCWLETSRPS